jgi:hypothetical protein
MTLKCVLLHYRHLGAHSPITHNRGAEGVLADGNFIDGRIMDDFYLLDIMRRDDERGRCRETYGVLEHVEISDGVISLAAVLEAQSLRLIGQIENRTLNEAGRFGSFMRSPLTMASKVASGRRYRLT